MYYRLLGTDGMATILQSKNPLSLKKLQTLVGGYIEPVPLYDGGLLMVNEEALLKGLPPNPHITQAMTPLALWKGHLYGNAVWGREDADGEFVGFSAAPASWVTS